MMSTKIPELVSLELAFSLRRDKGMEPAAIKSVMQERKIDPPQSFDIEHLTALSKTGVSNSLQNIGFAREELVRELCNAKLGTPQDDELLADWQTYSSRVSAGVNFEVNRKELDPSSRVETLGLGAWAVLRDIF